MVVDRLYYMDLLRGFLMMLGIVLHTMAVFAVDSNWKVSSPNSAVYAQPILGAIHLFRMPAFFIISGFFTALTLSRKRERNFITDRVLRLGIPMLFAGILFNLPMGNIINNGAGDIGWLDYLTTGGWLGHLWFLGVLILYSAVTALTWRWVRSILSSERKVITFLLFSFLALCYPVVLRIDWQMEAMGLKLLLVSVSSIFQYSPYFILGIIFYFKSGKLLLGNHLSKWVLLSSVFFSIWYVVEVRIITDILMFIMASAMSFTLFSFAEKFFSKPAKWKRKFSGSSYTVYLTHQPIIILLALYFINSSINVHIQLSAILLITFGLALFTHFILVERSRYLAFFMSGKPLRQNKA